MDIPILEIKEAGTVKDIKKGIVKVEGLSLCINGQLLEFSCGLKGIVVGFTKNEVLGLVLGDETRINPGEPVYSEEGIFKIPVGDSFVSRVVNMFCEPRDDAGPVKENDFYPIFRNAPEVLDRTPITEPFSTGIKTIDTTIPLGRGQRELILGDRVTGKTSILIDTILNQKDKNMICIYCWIGGSEAALLNIVRELTKKGAMEYTIIVKASASDSTAEQYLVPYAACSLGEYFMDQGKDVFVAFDNLTRHAWVYREISLLLERPPGREAYPGDIFYIHSQLMERAGRLNKEKGGGSMTFLPVVQTQEGDVTGLISSNLVSMTDGQIYLNTNLFNEGFRPAVDLGLSVSRIGTKVQSEALKEVSKELKREYAQYKELVSLTTIRTKLSADIERRLKKGGALRDLFIQDRGEPMSVEEIIISFYAFNSEHPDIFDKAKRDYFKKEIFRFLSSEYPRLLEDLRSYKMLTEDIKKRLDSAFDEFFRRNSNDAEEE
jgi:F-type H+/Na+-transporting ATPase subunit alpha